ncbi:TRAP transporter substrate-binding protein [Mastigocoleus testarum]|uniref:ABC transporter substrate-binding protein n=1 Tax=Mastigocoleus testarum BC008 TaxID=371196 RepID=A0A0V7ZYQ3_9CYAN|nr:hypothetical protein [Mastigocoleus testarum]KST69679.1 hypothetical protein BC008_05105 [Mastigocoleus testarum BC008]KST69696.1 hypothetical protein BC008_05175 [Mastigocoleus testarum BC008]
MSAKVCGQIPYIKWAELQIYAEEFPQVTDGIYDSEKTNELSRLLKIAASNTPKKYFKEIEAAAGIFNGLAVIVSIQRESKNPDKTKPKKSKLFPLLPTNRRNFLSIAALGSLAAIGSGITSQYLQMPKVTWRMANFLDGIYDQFIISKAPYIIRERIKKITNGRFEIEPLNDKKILTEDILKDVSDGKKVQCGFSGIYYNANKYKVLFFGCAIPHGLTPEEQTAWLLYKEDPQDKLTFIQKIYQRPELDLNVIPFPAAATGAQMGGWFKKKIETIEDFNGIIMRIPGLGGEVLKKFDVNLDKDLPGGAISLNKIAKALRDDKIQAAEWIGPYDDVQLGLHQAEAKYYYYPGWWEPSTTFDMLVNKDAWENLPPHYQEVFKSVCLETYTEILAEYNQKNSEKLAEIYKLKNITVSKFSPEIIKKTKEETTKLLKLYASNNDLFGEVYQKWNSFKGGMREWSNLNQ